MHHNIPPPAVPPTSLLDWALSYARRGWAVFPVWNVRPDRSCACGGGGPNCKPGKHPIASLAPNGFKNASTDPAQVTAWWTTWPEANIGMATGAPSGVYVVDLDKAKTAGVTDGVSAWREFEEDGDLPAVAQTGSGGYHLFYRHPGTEFRNTTKLLHPSIDTRGEGGYVLLAPSSHVSGGHYSWLGDVEPALMPLWLRNRLQTSRRRAARSATDEQVREHIVPREERRALTVDDLADLAASLLGSHIDAARDLLAVIDGRAWGLKGARDERLSKLCYSLVLRYPELEPESTALLFARACSAVETEDGAKTTTDWVAEKLCQKIGPVAAVHASQQADKDLLDELLEGLKPHEQYRDALADAKALAESKVPDEIRTLLGGEYARLLALGESAWLHERGDAREREEEKRIAMERAQALAQLSQPRRVLR